MRQRYCPATRAALRRTLFLRVLFIASPLLLVACNQQPPAEPQAPSAAATAPPSRAAVTKKPAEQQTEKAEQPRQKAEKIGPPPPFDGWPQPVLALVLTGQQRGYIEPCGCTGLENQKGGLARRHTLIQTLSKERGWPVVPLDLGGQIGRFGKQSEIKFQHTAEALRVMGYRAVTLGPDDLQASAGELLAGTNPPDDQSSLFVSANLAILDRTLQPRFVVIEAAGKRIGVTGALGKQHESKIKSDELVHEPPLEALRRVCQELSEQNCDLYVLLAQASAEEAQALAKELAIFDVVVVPGQGTVPPDEMESIADTKARLVTLGTKGMYVGVVGLFDDQQQPLRYESVPLDAQLADSPAMLKLFENYQEQLKSLTFEELGARPRPHSTGRQFVGSEKCGECHTKAYEKWSSTPHAHATESLAHPPNSRGEIARHFDPECLSCHVTGWEPQKFFPFETGYSDLQATPALQHNGCENCHSPGSAHVAAESGEGDPDEETLAKRRSEMRLPLADGLAERKCLECHDGDNSPDFHLDGAFERYWGEVEHRGKD